MFILDEGWAVNKKADLFKVVPEIDLKELIDYAKSKNVGLILWAGYWAFNRDMENVCKHYSQMGIKGFKVDFMNRDDQKMVEFYRKAAATAAKYHLLMDFQRGIQTGWFNENIPQCTQLRRRSWS
jgi:alpha-glucosidase